MCGPSIGADAPADVDLAAAMATARKRGIRAAAFRATDATTSGKVAQGIWVWDETSPIQQGEGGERDLDLILNFGFQHGRGHVLSA